MALIRRAPEAKDDLFAWWDGTQLEPSSELACAESERVVVLEARSEHLVTTLGPGHHDVTPALREVGDVLVLFVTTAPTVIEAEGVFDDHDEAPHVELSATVTVLDAVKAVGLLAQLDPDESPEDWVAEELMLAAVRAVDEHGGKLAQLERAWAEVNANALRLANEQLAAVSLVATQLTLALSKGR
jgi:hypothetical protein